MAVLLSVIALRDRVAASQKLNALWQQVANASACLADLDATKNAILEKIFQGKVIVDPLSFETALSLIASAVRSTTLMMLP